MTVLLRRPAALLGLLLVALHLAVAIAAPWIAPFAPTSLLDAPLEPPGATYWLGTDDLGRDAFSRLLWGGRVAMLVAFAAGAVAVLGGALLGLAAAYRRGSFDDVLMRLVEMKLAVPTILFVAIFVTGFGQSVPVLIVAVGIIQMMGVVRTTRAAGIVLMEQGYVRAAQLNGEGGATIILRELLPNVADLMAVEFALRASSALLLVSALSFLGLGISPPTPDWGLMVEDGMALLESEPALVLAPALCIATLVLGINLAAEGLSDALGLDAARGGGG
ncbi:ABC transporter permease [Roseomonas sp. CECT 9278]|uniref:ABC transporter permease n=1 Tax=Roseomonas sp. CECT 9278 TaxID=2845823 RepID=UPI001E3CB6FE|nr:ABC transporter permease [Roseomonas sp. CECT 9278]CAH0200843.1 Glutathione transport system permease protein GsiD [Roseomonas sp. CECT 9278]